MPNIPSTYQQAIFDWVLKGRGHAFVEAVAGSGKTWTLKESAKLLKSDALFCAFNKHIAVELQAKLRGTRMQVSTIHSHAFRAVRESFGKVRVDGSKYRKLTWDLIDDLSFTRKVGNVRMPAKTIDAVEEERPCSLVVRIVDLLRNNLVDEATEEAMIAITMHHGMDYEPELWPWISAVVPRLLRQGKTLARKVIDFTDMVWLPNVTPMCRVERFPWVFIDEAQDLNPAQLEIVMQSIAPGGRLLAVGDRRQAIYGFAGADTTSVEKIVERTDARILPLSICYRCPKSHIELAKTIVPQIEPAPGAADGVVEDVPIEKLPETLSEGDLVLCRTTSPLVGLCYELIAHGIAAKVRGKDIGRNLAALLEKIANPRSRRVDYADIPDAIDRWEADQIGKLLKRNRGDRDDPAVQSVEDRSECLRRFYQISGATSVADLKREIEDLFSDGHPAVMLSTVHRAKGLEENRVFILRPDLLPFPYARQPWQVEQELNLQYVAFTRAKSELRFIAL